MSEPICQSAAQQRAGRAGRTSPGYCLRLWSEKDNQARPEFDIPEICRIDLSQIYLNLMGFSLSFKDLKLIDSIPEGKIEKARQSLRALGAIDQNNSLSDHGKKISRLPIHPSWGHALLIAKDRGHASVIAMLLAMLDERPPVESGKLADFDHSDHPRSDPFCLLLAYEAAKRNKFNLDYCRNFGIHAKRCQDAEKVASALCQMVEESFLPLVPTYEELAKTLLCCFHWQFLILLVRGRSIYQDAQGRHLHLSKRSVVKKEKFLLPLKLMEKKIKRLNGYRNGVRKWLE